MSVFKVRGEENENLYDDWGTALRVKTRLLLQGQHAEIEEIEPLSSPEVDYSLEYRVVIWVKTDDDEWCNINEWQERYQDAYDHGRRTRNELLERTDVSEFGVQLQRRLPNKTEYCQTTNITDASIKGVEDDDWKLIYQSDSEAEAYNNSESS